MIPISLSSGYAPPDPYQMVGIDGMILTPGRQSTFRYNTNGRTQVSVNDISSVSRGVGMFIGTSNVDNYVNSLCTPTNPNNIYNFSINDSGIYRSVEPLLGCWLNTEVQPTAPPNNGNSVQWTSDRLVTAGVYSNFINVPIGMTAAVIADWAVGGALNERIGVAFKRLASLGLSVNFVVVQAGENDITLGTTQDQYANYMQSVISTIRTYYTGSILVSQTSWLYGVTSPAIRAAQASVVNTSQGIYAGPNTDTITNTGRWDTTHWNAAGASQLADLWVASIQAVPH